MQLTSTKKNLEEQSSDDHATDSLLYKNGSETRHKNVYIIIAFILSIIITAFISSIVTYFIVNDNNTNNNGDDDIDIIENYDIAIIGAGSTGLIQAFFLLKQYPDLKIGVLEQLERIGGRQFTSFIHKIDENNNIINTIHFENGAMRFNSYHTLTLKLLSHLNLCDDIILLWDGLNVNVSSHQIYQYRNKRITGHELYGINENQTINYFSSIFNVSNDEQSYLDGNQATIWRQLYDKILLENNNGIEPITEEDWYLFRNNYTFNGEYLYNFGESIALRIIGNYSGEIKNYLYRSNEEQINVPYSRNLAMLLYETFDRLQYIANHTNNTNEQWTLKNGYGSMNEMMYKTLIDNENIDILFKNKVTSINKINHDKHNNYYKYLIESNFGEYYYSANKIILSIPPDKLLKLLPYSPIINTVKFRNMLDSFVWSGGSKINLIYDSSFWIDENLQDLIPSDTDLQIKRFMVVNAWSNDTLTAIHIYPSGINNAFWYGAQLIGDKYPIHESLRLDNNDTLTVASIVVVEEAVKQLQQLTQKFIPMPLAAFINIMGENMETSGVTRFKSTRNADKIINESYTPIYNEDIFMAISDFAWYYGWMESCISAAINNMEKNFNIQNPLTQQPICYIP